MTVGVGVMAMALEILRPGTPPRLVEVPNIVVEWLTFLQLGHYSKGFLGRICLPQSAPPRPPLPCPFSPCSAPPHRDRLC